MNPRFRRILAVVQGLYFGLTGLWSIVSIETFMMITGPKTDLWLVKTVGILVIAIGATLLFAVWRDKVGEETRFLAISCAAALGMVESAYAMLGTISAIYLLDAFVEALFILGWLLPVHEPFSTMVEDVAVQSNRVAP